MEDHAYALARDLPVKTRDMHNHHIDSTFRDDITFRSDEIVIAACAKSGTTWTQQIVGQLIFDGCPDVATAELSPWVNLRAPCAKSSCLKSRRKPIVGSSRPTCRSMHSYSAVRQNTSISVATPVTSCGVCTTTTRRPTSCGTTP